MKPLGIVGAVVGGVVGALLWGFFTNLTGLEVGYVAWGVGGLVGFGCLCLGGSGSTAGAVCAIVAFFSILGGKFFATDLAIDQAIEGEAHKVHEKMVADARDFTDVQEYEYAEFMVAHGYTYAEDASEVAPEDLDYFKTYWAPGLQQVNASPDYATWRESEYAERYVQTRKAGLSVTDLVLDNLGAIDIIFFLLGIVTAFKVGQAEGLARHEERLRERQMVAAAESEANLQRQPREEREEIEEREAEPQL